MPPKRLLPFDEYAESLNRKRIAAGIVFRDESARLLLVKPYYKTTWDLPGGAADADETPWDCARRELKEELGLDLPLGRLLVVDYAPRRPPLAEGITFIFDGGVISAGVLESVSFVDSEITAAACHSLAEAQAKVIPRLVGRLAAACRALDEGTVILCSDGQPV
ncbi:MAG TPA: NUDIX hydrolase [Pseudonocardiaceae bacterium]|nr:NUDIX hydrolase [Pseudonocardiaceae bacterium]